MSNRCQRGSRKSKEKFEVIGGRELALRCARRPLDRRRAARSGTQVPPRERLSRAGGVGAEAESALDSPATGGVKC